MRGACTTPGWSSGSASSPSSCRPASARPRGVPARSAPRRVRLEPRDDRPRRLPQPALLRPRRALRRRAGRALRHAAGRRRSPRRHRRLVAPDARDDRALAALSPLGRRQRDRDGRRLRAARGDHRQPLVRRAAGPRYRDPHGEQRLGAARLPAAPGLGRRLRLALRRAPRGRCRARPCPPARRRAHARPTRARSAPSVRSRSRMGGAGGRAARASARRSQGSGSARARGRSGFWQGTFFICGATTNGLVSTHLIPAAHDHGIAQVSAASLLALIGVFDIVGTVGSGWLTDRYDPRKLLLVYYGFRGLALLALPVAFDSGRYAALVAFAVVYGLDWVATVPPTSALATSTFQPRPASCSRGSSAPTSSAPRPRRGLPASSEPRPASTPSPSSRRRAGARRRPRRPPDQRNAAAASGRGAGDGLK